MDSKLKLGHRSVLPGIHDVAILFLHGLVKGSRDSDQSVRRGRRRFRSKLVNRPQFASKSCYFILSLSFVSLFQHLSIIIYLNLRVIILLSFGSLITIKCICGLREKIIFITKYWHNIWWRYYLSAFKVSYLIVDEMHHDHPELIRDQYWDEIFPTELPYTAASQPFREEHPQHSTAGIQLSAAQQELQPSSVKIEDLAPELSGYQKFNSEIADDAASGIHFTAGGKISR